MSFTVWLPGPTFILGVPRTGGVYLLGEEGLATSGVLLLTEV